ncbi:monovalent cation/H+ antiporter subunit D family protein [Deferribacter thermophilus]|uniref:monovalent cation/H+ antiporter subunit D family protein n=1 Tax=Deferribacter thermophilus TaxID=53573 RepID=UPI003C29BA1B
MTEVVNSSIPLIAVIIPLFITLPILLTKNNPNIRDFFSVAGAFTTFLVVFNIYLKVKNGEILEFQLIEFIPGLVLKFKVDAFGVFFALMASFLWFVTTFYSIGYMRGNKEKNQTRFFVFFAISMFAAISAAFSGNLITLYLFYEILTFATYPLVAHKQTKEAIQGARRYLSYLLLTSVMFFLPALIYIYTTIGNLDFTLGGALNSTNNVDKSVLGIMLLLFVFGSAKAAVMPFHLWLPSAMVAPTPVSALLHAVAVVKTGVFVIVRVFVYIYGIDFLKDVFTTNLVTIFAAFTIIVASMVALRQDNIKARLAYSTISQLSYIVLSVSLLSITGAIGAIMHIVAHGFAKITLFFWAGAVYVANHKTKVSELNGIAKYMPYSMAAFTVGALSMIGFPPMAGLISKWFIANGAVEAGKAWVIGILVISALLNAGYFVPIFINAYLKPAQNAHEEHLHEAPLIMLLPIIVTSILTFAIFIYPDMFLNLAKIALGIGG